MMDVSIQQLNSQQFSAWSEEPYEELHYPDER